MHGKERFILLFVPFVLFIPFISTYICLNVLVAVLASLRYTEGRVWFHNC